MYGMKSEDGTGSRRPLLGDVGMSPRQFHFPIPKAPQNGHENPFCGVLKYSNVFVMVMWICKFQISFQFFYLVSYNIFDLPQCLRPVQELPSLNHKIPVGYLA